MKNDAFLLFGPFASEGKKQFELLGRDHAGSVCPAAFFETSIRNTARYRVYFCVFCVCRGEKQNGASRAADTAVLPPRDAHEAGRRWAQCVVSPASSA